MADDYKEQSNVNTEHLEKIELKNEKLNNVKNLEEIKAQRFFNKLYRID